MIQTKDNYVYGTAAEKIQYNVYEENKVLKAKRRQRTNNKEKLKAVGMVLFIFMLCITVIYRYALITELNYKVDRQVKKYNNVKNENIKLKIDIQNKMDLNKVREIAETKLGMQKPDKYQVVFIKVPKADCTKVAEEDEETDKKKDSIFTAFLDKFGKFTHLLY